ncbi:hypothetical protein ACHAXT_011127 [Thalassiosira profunda]
MGSAFNDAHERSKDKIRGWAVALLYPSMILFTLVNVQWSSFSRRAHEAIEHDEQSLEEEATRLLSHVLVTISYWHSPDGKGDGAQKSLGNTNDWYSFHQVETGELPYNLPFYHREIVADYLDRDKDGTNLTNMVNGDLPPPTAYSFMEADNVVSGLSGGIWAGLYVLTAQHLINYYNSGDFWTLPDKYKYTREIQLHDVIHGSKAVGKPDKRSGDNTLVPYDEKTGMVDVIAGVHHQSDKYASGQSRFGKLCVEDLFNSTVESSDNVKLGLGRRARNKAIRKGDGS